MTANSSDYGRLFFQAEAFRAGRLSERWTRPAGAITEQARHVPLFRDCDVLVAGGRPAGTAAAIADYERSKSRQLTGVTQRL